jgi:hypothetical protein
MRVPETAKSAFWTCRPQQPQRYAKNERQTGQARNLIHKISNLVFFNSCSRDADLVLVVLDATYDAAFVQQPKIVIFTRKRYRRYMGDFEAIWEHRQVVSSAILDGILVGDLLTCFPSYSISLPVETITNTF